MGSDAFLYSWKREHLRIPSAIFKTIPDSHSQTQPYGLKVLSGSLPPTLETGITNEKAQATLCAESLSCVPLSATLWMVARQPPLSVEFSRREHCSGFCHFLLQIFEPAAPALAGRFFTAAPPGKLQLEL